MDRTSEELALLQAVAKEPTTTPQALAQRIGKSPRTVKTLTVKLQEKGLLTREGGKRSGRWVVKAELH